MTLTKEQSEALREAAKPLVQWLNENCHPHCAVIVDLTHAELLEGVASHMIEEYLKD